MIQEQLGDSLCPDISDAELVLFSCGDCAEGLTPLRRIRTGRRGQRSWAPIVIGGMGALSPGALGERGATVVLGDYRRFLSVLLDKGLEVASNYAMSTTETKAMIMLWKLTIHFRGMRPVDKLVWTIAMGFISRGAVNDGAHFVKLVGHRNIPSTLSQIPFRAICHLEK